MGLKKFVGVRKSYETTETGSIWKEKVNYKGIFFPKQFFRDMEIRKSQRRFKCILCKESKSKGIRYIGTHYDRICQDCFLEWIKNSKKTFKQLFIKIREIERIWNKNKSKWEKEVLVDNL